MSALLHKELRLVNSPMTWLFLPLVALVLIPDYPYQIGFIYQLLAVFFAFQAAREGRDLEFSMLLPVRKADLVNARVLLVVVIQMAAVVVGVPLLWLRSTSGIANAVGLDASPAVLGSVLVMYGIFTIVFLPYVYRRPDRLGVALALAGAAIGVWIAGSEIIIQAVDPLRRWLDEPGGLGAQWAWLAVGACVYAALVLLARGLAVRAFDTVDL